MVIVLEGASGAGKTTLALGLQRALGWPVYRPFRGGVKSHKPGEGDPRLGSIGLPVNTWLEDLFTADVLATVKPNLILDRSALSGLAYADGLGIATKHTALEVWAERIVAAGGILVLAELDDVARRDRGGRTGSWESIALRDLAWYIGSQTELPVYKLDTSHGIDVCVESLSRLARGLKPAGFEPPLKGWYIS